MKSKKLLLAVLVTLVVGLLIGVRFAKVAQERYIKRHYQFTNTPTIFVHGWTGGKASEQLMVDSAEDLHVAKHKMTIRVRADGTLKIKGHINQRQKNSIIEVIFNNNRAGELQDAAWLKLIMRRLKDKYGVTHYNAVGHSMGAYAWTYYNMDVGNQKAYPKLNKAVLIAGPYNGIINNHKLNQPLTLPLSKLWDDPPNENRLLKNGKPKIIHPEYKLLLKLRDRFPKQAKVLNIYGDLNDGSHSDGVVTMPSVRSLGYLLRDRVAYYREYRVTGPTAQHSKLHQHNLTVNRTLINFLWGK